ncbi:STAS domain-containing protein [Streptomyces sp. KR80]|uniref:STAS domain-containing protein n=1 Tax=Streptomyces sp. KR80 TaxID=3457426 RepID=UPI003FCF403D
MADPEEHTALTASGSGPPQEGSTVVLTVAGPVARADVPLLCERLRLLLLEHANADRVTVDVGSLAADLAALEALARMQLTARRLGRRIRLCHADTALRNLLAWAGLDDLLPPATDLGLEPGGQSEQREQVRGVQEGVESGDPPV